MLTIQGEEETAVLLLDLLGKAAGLRLAIKAEQVSVEAEGDLAPGTSRTLRERLLEIIGDRARTAAVKIVGPNLHFGVFGAIQSLPVVTVLGIERDVPGLGVVIAIHELWEQYISRKSDGTQTKYGPAHLSAVGVERAVGIELTGRDVARVAASTLRNPTGDDYVLDLGSSMLRLTTRPVANERAVKGRFVASLHDRRLLWTTTLTAFPAGRLDEALLTTTVAQLKGDRAATARITGLRTADELDDAARLRAQTVCNALSVLLKQDQYDEEAGGIAMDSARAQGPGGDIGARRAWVNPHSEVGLLGGARIDLYTPS